MDVKYEITERIAILSQKGDWTKELNMVSWNDRLEKFDIRDWNHEEGRVGKGTGLTVKEMQNLKEVLHSIEI